VKERCDKGRTPLIWAVRNGHESIERLLLDRGANFDQDEDYRYGRTPLF
jgi:ankyrin repeat protein